MRLFLCFFGLGPAFGRAALESATAGVLDHEGRGTSIPCRRDAGASDSSLRHPFTGVAFLRQLLGDGITGPGQSLRGNRHGRTVIFDRSSSPPTATCASGNPKAQQEFAAMNGGLEEVLLRVVDEVSDAVKPWLAPAVESEVKRQLSADPASTPVGPPTRATRTGSGLQLTLSACGFGPKTRTRIAVEAMTAVEGALRERLPEMVRAEIARQRPISERAQKEFDEWAAASRDRSARYATLAQLRAAGRKFAAGGKGA